MAIYWIDPHTLTNGSGTYASPWSFASAATRTGLVSGDEIRIKGVYKSSLFTATSYTATITDNYRVTVTAGGGLGADFVAGDLVYFEEFGTFFAISSKSTNILSSSVSSSGILPIPNTSRVGTSTTIRKLNTATYGPSSTSSTVTLMTSATAVNNLTITDCWVSETTRVTDGTALTIINGNNSGGWTLLWDNSFRNHSGWTVDLPNTCLVSSATSGAPITLSSRMSNSTINIYGVFTGYIYNSGGILLEYQAGIYSYNNTYNITHYMGQIGSGTGGSNCTINVSYVYFGNITYLCAISIDGLTLNIGKVIVRALSNYIYTTTYNIYNCNSAVNFIDYVDSYTSVGTLVAIAQMNGYRMANVSLGSSFIFYHNKRVSQITSTTHLAEIVIGDPNAIYPNINSGSFTYTSTKFRITVNAYYQKINSIFNQKVTCILPDPSSYTMWTTNYVSPNQLYVFKDGSLPKEILVSMNTGNYGSGTVGGTVDVISDSSVYNQNTPSLKATLSTWDSVRWTPNGQPVAFCSKEILIPCTQGQQVTVSGFIRSNISVISGTDVSMHIALKTDILYSQNISASYNVWQSFSFTFTPTETAEYVLSWRMHFPSTGSIWLSDLTIS